MKFSVILPVYQAETTIERCLDSLLNQKYTDMELIVVNDGSTDRCGQICREYAQRYPYIRYFEKENGGVSSARNLGLDHAQGEYILFVDSDDYVADWYFQELDSAINGNSQDLLLFGNYNSKVPGKKMNCHDFYASDPESIAKMISNLMRANRFNAPVLKVFSNVIVTNYSLRFDQSIAIAEDLNFIFAYVVHCRSVRAIPKPLYLVDESNLNSLSRKEKPDLADQLMRACLSMMEMLDGADLPQKVIRQYQCVLSWMYYRSVYSSAKELSKTVESAQLRRSLLHIICKKYTMKRVPTPGWKNKMMAIPVHFGMTSLIDYVAKGRK